MTVSTLTRHPKPLTRAVFDFPTTAIKVLGKRVVGGYGVVFGSPQRRDKQLEYFDKDTDLWLDHYDNQPVFVDHTLDEDGNPTTEPRKVKIGKIKRYKIDNKGVFFEVELDDSDIADNTLNRIQKGEMFWSSGAPAHLVRYEDDGRIDNWPVIELSATDDPAEPHGTDIRMIKAYLPDYDADRAQQEFAVRHARRTGDVADSKTTPSIKTNRSSNMVIKLSSFAIKDMHKQAVDARMDGIKSVYERWLKAKAKQDSMDEEDENKMDDNEETKTLKSLKEMLEEGLQDAADSVAAVAGTDPAESMAMLVGYALDNLDTSTQAEVEDAIGEAVDDVEEELDVEEEDMAMMSRRKSNTGRRENQIQQGVLYTPQQKGVKFNQQAHREAHGFLRLVRAMVNQDFHYLKARRKPVYDGYVAKRGKEWAVKALGTSPDTAGGYLVPVEQSNEIIGNLYDESLFLNSNRLVSQRQMISSQLSIPRATSAITVGHIGENSQLSDADVTFGQELLQARKAYAMIRISREEVEDSDPDVEQWYISEVGMALAELVDQMVLEGSGVNSEPLGISNRANVNTTALNAAPTYANVVDTVTRIQQSKIKVDNSWAWVMNPRDAGGLQQLEDTAGNLIWTTSELGMGAVNGQPPMLNGWPVFLTNQVSIDTANNNETKIYFGKWKDVVVAVRKSIEIQMTDQRYWDFDQIAIRAILRYDVGMFRDESIEVLTDVRTS